VLPWAMASAFFPLNFGRSCASRPTAISKLLFLRHHLGELGFRSCPSSSLVAVSAPLAGTGSTRVGFVGALAFSWVPVSGTLMPSRLP
jgi:hypothetical protein